MEPNSINAVREHRRLLEVQLNAVLAARVHAKELGTANLLEHQYSLLKARFDLAGQYLDSAATGHVPEALEWQVFTQLGFPIPSKLLVTGQSQFQLGGFTFRHDPSYGLTIELANRRYVLRTTDDAAGKPQPCWAGPI